MNLLSKKPVLSKSALDQIKADRLAHGAPLVGWLFWVLPFCILLGGAFVGGDLAWAQAVVAFVVYSLFCVGLVLLYIGHMASPKVSFSQRLFLLAFFGFCLFVELQASSWVGWSVLPTESARLANVTWLLFVFSLCCVLFVRHRQHVFLLLWALVLIAFAHVVVGTTLFSANAVYDFRGDVVRHTVLKGLFINRNNFAAFVNLSLGVGIGLMLYQIAQTESAAGQGFRRFIRNVSNFFLSAKAPLRIVLMALVIGLIASRSRAANGLFFASTFFLGAFSLWLFARSHTYAKKAVKVLFVTVVLFDVVVLGSVIGLDRLVQRFEQARVAQQIQEEAQQAKAVSALSDEVVYQPSRMDEDFTSRVAPALSVMQGLKQAPILGSGLGTFQWLFPQFKDANSQFGFYKYAHSDPLQFVLEVGVLGSLLLLAILVVPVHYGVRLLLNKRRRTRTRALALGLVAGLVMVVLHSFVDFPFQIFGVALPFVLVLNCLMMLDLPEGPSNQTQFIA